MSNEIAVDEMNAPGGAHSALGLIVGTTGALWPSVLRVTLGGVMLPHALQKTFGLFGGSGFSGTMGYLVNVIHLPVPFAALVIAGEFLGALGLLFGAFTRVAAVAIATVMVGAIVTVHLPNGFFMNWFGNHAGEGYEYHLLVLGMAAAIVIGGGGRGSVDARLSNGEVVYRSPDQSVGERQKKSG